MEKLKKIRLTTTQLLATGFLGIILLGGILLWLPISNTRPISLIDALFTAVTSVCVTGLVTVTPAVQFTLFGKIVLLILIQIGGLGIYMVKRSMDEVSYAYEDGKNVLRIRKKL